MHEINWVTVKSKIGCAHRCARTLPKGNLIWSNANQVALRVRSEKLRIDSVFQWSSQA